MDIHRIFELKGKISGRRLNLGYDNVGFEIVFPGGNEREAIPMICQHCWARKPWTMTVP